MSEPFVEFIFEWICDRCHKERTSETLSIFASSLCNFTVRISQAEVQKTSCILVYEPPAHAGPFFSSVARAKPIVSITQAEKVDQKTSAKMQLCPECWPGARELFAADATGPCGLFVDQKQCPRPAAQACQELGLSLCLNCLADFEELSVHPKNHLAWVSLLYPGSEVFIFLH